MTIVTIPIPLPSAANLREHHMVRHRRVKQQRQAVRYALPTRTLHAERNWLDLLGSIVVTLTRISPRELDDDNLATAFKAVRDQVAENLIIDDRDKRVAWRYEQERGPQAIRIALACVDNRAQPEVPW